MGNLQPENEHDEHAFEHVSDSRGVPAWAVSLIVHVAVLLTLASLVLDPPGVELPRVTVFTEKPTGQAEEVVDAIRSIPIDES
ncbi:hypothetical protein EBU58_14590, partial [bacterium]|nr:hypothetical protein [bacterium]